MHSRKAVADAGGWKDVTTLVRCYQQTDERTLLAVMANDSSESGPRGLGACHRILITDDQC